MRMRSPCSVLCERDIDTGTHLIYVVDESEENGNHAVIRRIDQNGIRLFADTNRGILDVWTILLIPERFRTNERHMLYITNTSMFFIARDGTHQLELDLSHPSTHLLFQDDEEEPDDRDDYSAHISSMMMDSRGDVILANQCNSVILRMVIIDTKAYVTTLAGRRAPGSPCIDHKNPLMATFSSPSCVCLDEYDNIFVTDEYHHRIRRIDARSGEVITIAGNDQKGMIDGLGAQSSFANPISLTWEEKTQSLFVGDGNAIRRIVLNQREGQILQGYVTTLAGSIEQGSVDGDGKVARFGPMYSPSAIEASEYPEAEWRNRVRDLEYFYYWPPGVLDIVLDYLPTFVSLLVSDIHNHSIRRVIITF